MITASALIGLVVGITLVMVSKGASMTDRVGVLILLAVGIGLRFGPVGDKVRGATRNIGQWVTERHWDGIGPDLVALLPALLAIAAGAIVVLALTSGRAEEGAIVAAVLLPILLTSVGTGSVFDLIGQVFSAVGDLAAVLVDWTTNDLGRVAGGGRG